MEDMGKRRDDGVFNVQPKCRYCDREIESEIHRFHALAQELFEENDRLKAFIEEIVNGNKEGLE